ncbi:hypothetical protein HYN56_23405 [Flavobacterium crocinum]|uniref:Uncharacterized protein n=1 Tax=Flavobacterium crocinum TaxID=2183896 RepID=A0A2S1YSF7_9FLAO|nr:hypothetical protein HYN56_23405 [Flavobacterium crocinum]
MISCEIEFIECKITQKYVKCLVKIHYLLVLIEIYLSYNKLKYLIDFYKEFMKKVSIFKALRISFD